MKTERCERCPHEHTDKCDTCGSEPEEMELTYTFVLREGVCSINGLHSVLDLMVSRTTGFEVVKSTLESPDEESEHDFEEGAVKDENHVQS